MTDEYEKEDDEEYEDEEATSESEEEYEDEAGVADASDESEEDEDSVESWGYEEKKSRFSKEMLAGFAAIAVLCAVFGIVVYKKMPGAGDSNEVAAAPDASLGNPESDLGDPESTDTPPEEDPNDPFRVGAETELVAGNLEPQNEPGLDDGTSNASLNGDPFGTTNPASDSSTNFAPGSSPSEVTSLFPNEGSNGQGISNEPFGNEGALGSNEPFASNLQTQDLFSGQSEPELGSNSEPPFGSSPVGTSTTTNEYGRPLASNEFPATAQPETSAAFPGSSTGEFADTSRPDPFGGPDRPSSDFSDGTATAYPATTEFGSNEPLGNEPFPQDDQDPFPQGDQFAENNPGIDSSLNSGFPDDSTSRSQPDLTGSPNEFSSSSNEPFGSATGSSLDNEPFGANSDSGESQPTGLFDRGSEASLNGGGLNDPSSPAMSNDQGFGNDSLPGSEFGTPQPSTTGSEFGSLDSNFPGSDTSFDNGPSTSSSTPFGNEEPFGTSDTGSTETPFGNAEPASSTNEPFGSTGTASNDPFPGSSSDPSTGFDTGNGFDAGSSEPANLFPDSNSLPSSTASNESFQPPITSSPDSSFPSSSGSPISSGGPFGNEPLGTASSGSPAGPSTFASQPANSGTYTVQDGDSYWRISKKVYGTAKYFQVLADHNRRTIADPQKMKTGISIETPPASVLQRKIKTVRRTAPSALAGNITPSGRADRAGSAGPIGSANSTGESVVVSRRETKPKEPAGILFNDQGYPMYRIGETDTLTSIASDHLGRASRWQQVYNMNRDQLQSPDKLQIGMLLKLPADASRVPLVDRTSSLR